MINKELSNKQNANNKFTDKDLLILWLGNNDIQSNLNLAAIFTKQKNNIINLVENYNLKNVVIISLINSPEYSNY